MRVKRKMHNLTMIGVLVFLLIVSSIPSQINVVSPASAGKYGDIIPTSYEIQLLEKINENRTAHNAPELKLNATLWWVARAHSQDMIDNDFFDHTSSVEGPFNGASFRERVNDHAEYENGYIGECIAMKGSGIDVEWCMSAWKNSPPHWDIIINPNLKEVGLGILVGEWDGYPNSALYTADFGGPSISVDLAHYIPLQFDPQSPIEGEEVIITTTIENLGNSDAYPVNVRFYDGDPFSGGVQIGEKDVPHILVHGESIELSVSWDTHGESGIHNIHVLIDENNIIPETNENNNEYSDTLTISPPDSFIQLDYGWNLVSFPEIVTVEDIDTVLDSINGQYDIVQYYDSQDETNPWKNYHIQKTPYMNDLSSLNNKMGFLIHVMDSQGANLVVDGEVPTTTQTIALKEGWNLVGYPSNTSRSRDSALNNLAFDNEIDAIQFYDSSQNKYLDLDENSQLAPGEGYWMHATMDCEWILNN
jgi:uncharacterized protein YkwD